MEEVVDCQNELDPEVNPPNAEEEMAMRDDDDIDEEEEHVKEWRPEDGLQEGEVLDYDPSVYVTMHQLNLEVRPRFYCFSFSLVFFLFILIPFLFCFFLIVALFVLRLYS